MYAEKSTHEVLCKAGFYIYLPQRGGACAFGAFFGRCALCNSCLRAFRASGGRISQSNRDRFCKRQTNIFVKAKFYFCCVLRVYFPGGFVYLWLLRGCSAGYNPCAVCARAGCRLFVGGAICCLWFIRDGLRDALFMRNFACCGGSASRRGGISSPFVWAFCGNANRRAGKLLSAA